MTHVDYLPRGTVAHDVARLAIAVRLLNANIYDTLPGYIRRALTRNFGINPHRDLTATR